MKILSAIFFWLIVLSPVAAAANPVAAPAAAVRRPPFVDDFEKSPELQQLLDRAIRETLRLYRDRGLEPDLVAATLIDLADPESPKRAAYRGDRQIYPASVVKMFYMVALHRWLEDGRVRLTPELSRGLRDMIVDSSNEATGYILDVLTDTSSGAELPANKFRRWAKKRNRVNRYFAGLGYRNINVNQKTHCEDAYGVEQQFRNYRGENRNMLTTDAAARLLTEIVRGRAVSAERSRQMMRLMHRDWEKPVADPAAREFISPALPPGTKLWSKEGWTSKTRHDAAYIETPGGRRLVLVIFTENVAREPEIIPEIARRVLKGLSGDPV